MNHEQEANYIAKYAIIQEALNNALSLVIQVFGFSIAAIIALVVAALQAQNQNISLAIILIINVTVLLSFNYVLFHSKSITETEAYIAVFIEPKISDFGWKKLLFEKFPRNSKKKYAIRFPLNNPDSTIFAYVIILLLIILLLYFRLITVLDEASLIIIIITSINLVSTLLSAKYNTEEYYFECQEYFKKRKQQQQDDNLSIQEAADVLNMSSSFLVKLLEEGKIPFIESGSEYWIRFEDLRTYKKQRDSQRQEGLREITQFLQEEGFYKDGEN